MSTRLLARSGTMTLKVLIGSGDKIGLFTLPFLLVGLALNIAYPAAFRVGGPPDALRLAAAVVLVVGVTVWAWSIAMILRKVPRGELMTSGPYSLVRHPLYTAVALLVLPSIGLLVNTWLGALVGFILYVASRRYVAEEEAVLSKTFGSAWERYRAAVRIPWL